LDQSSTVGEGFLIGNEATLQRLIFAKGAPHAALVQRIWAHLAIEGNICCSKAGPSATDFKTGVIWFARGHSRGPTLNRTLATSDLLPDDKDLLGLVRQVCGQQKCDRLLQRDGPCAASYLRTQNCQELWQAAKEEHEREQGLSKAPPYNIWSAWTRRRRCTRSMGGSPSNWLPHLVLDGRLSQKRRGELAKLFKQGPLRAVTEGLIGRCGTHPRCAGRGGMHGGTAQFPSVQQRHPHRLLVGV
jgi:hypothetical protein